MNLYRNFVTTKDIDEEYNAVLGIDNLAMYSEPNAERSKDARTELTCFENISYGSSEDETLDVFPSNAENSPVVVFIHGGYWKRLSSKDFSFVAKGLVAKGFTVILTNYSLCPKVSITEITEQNCAAIKWAYNNAHKFNGRNQNIFVCGHSAGGQQSSMLALGSWHEKFGLPNNVIKGCIAISGIYDLSPLIFSWLQADIQLTDEIIFDQSPLLKEALNSPPTLLIVGEEESSEFRRQSTDYATKLSLSNNDVQLFIVPAKNHFTIVQELYQSNSEVCIRIEQFIKLNSVGDLSF